MYCVRICTISDGTRVRSCKAGGGTGKRAFDAVAGDDEQRSPLPPVSVEGAAVVAALTRRSKISHKPSISLRCGDEV